MTRIRACPGLESIGYQCHGLHSDTRVWVEKNCYVDVFIELLHALRLEPLAMLGTCAEVDFEGDNVTFYKPSHDDLREFYGLDVQELNVWRPLLEHVVEHLGAGKFVSTEADSYFLPDTDGTDYRRNHVKTTIIIADVDPATQRLGYFHNASYHTLAADDFAGLFRLHARPDDVALPLFAELIRVDRLVQRAPLDLATIALRRLAVHVERRPRRNPIIAFQHRFERDLPDLQARGLMHYHAWAFATVRQIGATSELLAAHLRWLHDIVPVSGLESAATAFDQLSTTAKTFILKAARAVNNRKAFDAPAICGDMAASWERGMANLTAAPFAAVADQGVLT